MEKVMPHDLMGFTLAKQHSSAQNSVDVIHHIKTKKNDSDSHTGFRKYI